MSATLPGLYPAAGFSSWRPFQDNRQLKADILNMSFMAEWS
jgi:hypothetical protein